MPGSSVITIGNFDGPHLGHLAILRQARRLAEVHGNASVIALTFDPPPVRLLRPDAEPPRIASLADRCAWLRRGGADRVEVLRPDAAMLEQSPRAFLEEVVGRFDPAAIVEGPDFRFGRGRAGGVATLSELGSELGFETCVVEPHRVVLSDLQEVPVSSSLVRWLVGRGRVADAAVCLGRRFSLSAEVVQGEQRGRTLGIPTANLDAETLRPYIIPADGVYAAYAQLDATEAEGGSGPADELHGAIMPAAVSVGVKPTFGRRALTVEAHLLDRDVDLYGRRLTLHFARWVRDQYPFPGVDALRQQLHRDIATVRRWAQHDPHPAPAAVAPPRPSVSVPD